jgi:hypothetical protein
VAQPCQFDPFQLHNAPAPISSAQQFAFGAPILAL